MGLWRVTVFLASLSYHGKSEKIRCYCNLNKCVSNNSSCSQENGGCYTLLNIPDIRESRRTEHGCLHLLSRERQKECGNISGSSMLLCCKTDMCNKGLNPRTILTQAIIGSLMNVTEGSENLIKNLNVIGSYNRKSNEVWFKAATIAVPICGAIILFLLMALAFKIIRVDNLHFGKYKGKSKSSTKYSDSIPVVAFKAGELNSEDLSKKIPLLYESRQKENFRNFTTVRIHFGQNVNILKDMDEKNKIEKNLENAKMNLEKPRREVATTSALSSEETNNNYIRKENNSNSTLDVRVQPQGLKFLPVIGLNLDKSENLSNCNLYRNSRFGYKPFKDNVKDKIYDKYLL